MVVDATPVAGVCDAWAPADGGGLPEGDSLVSVGAGFCLAVLTADCAPVALSSREGVLAAVHVGWRGLLDGVVEASIDAMRALGSSEVYAGIGPCIHPCCYEFGDAELAPLVARFGERAARKAPGGGQAFDLPYALRHAITTCGAKVVADSRRCTACSADYFSYRAGRDEARQALLVWSCEEQQ